MQFLYKKKIGGKAKLSDAFTLIELLISVAIFSIISIVAVINLASFRSNHFFDLSAGTVVDVINNAQQRSILGGGGTTWGIKFTNNIGEEDSMQIFYGTSYNTSSVVYTGTLGKFSEFLNPAEGYSKTIIFDKLTGKPTKADTIVLRRPNSNDLYIISISSIGKISKIKENSLLGYWGFDQIGTTTVYDSSGNGNNGTMYSSSTPKDLITNTGCISGACLSLNGIDEYATVNDLDPGQGFSGIVWVKFNNVDSQQIILGQNASSPYEYQLQMQGIGNSYKFRIRVDSNLGYDTTDSTTQASANLWYFIAWTYNDTKLKIYVNGIDETNVINDTATGQIVDNNTETGIGAENNLNLPTNGYIDDVRIYNRVLSANEIKEIYESY